METIQKNRSKKIRRNIIIVLSIGFCLMALRYCAIIRLAGPFEGKVVDVQTKEPLEGAAVVVWLYIVGFSIAGDGKSVADVFETLTDEKGEFRIPVKLVTPWRLTEKLDDRGYRRLTPWKPLQCWDNNGFYISIFKPGYGAYPGHPQTFRSPELKGVIRIQENDHNTYFLPPLLTKEERKENLYNIRKPSFDFDEKYPKLLMLQREERANIDL